MAAVHESGEYGWRISIFSWFGTIWPFSVPQHEKKNLAGKQYRTDNEVISAVEDFFEDPDETVYTMGIQVLKHRWKKSVRTAGVTMLEEKKKINHIWSNLTTAS